MTPSLQIIQPGRKHWLAQVLQKPVAIILIFFAVAVITYGPNLPYLGLYWDSWPMNWIAQTRGSIGLSDYFSTNRPVWGLLYQLTTSVFGANPLIWNTLALLLRGIVAVAIWGLIRLIWPERVELGVWTGLLSLVYPGFQQQSIGFLYTHFYFVFLAFLGSLACSLLAHRFKNQRWLWLALGLGCSAINLLMMEYYFVLELIRPVILWLVFLKEPGGKLQRLKRIMAAWAPYLFVFVGAVLWRSVFFRYQTTNYQFSFLSELKTQPVQAVLNLVAKIFDQIWISTGQAWLQTVNVWLNPNESQKLMLLFGLVFGASFAIIAIVGWNIHRKSRYQPSWQPLVLVAFGLALAGWPFLLTDAIFRLQFAFDRFTLPFLFGASLLLAVLVEWIPSRRIGWLVLAGLVGLGSAYQTELGVRYREDWVAQRNFFWQLTWRIPNLQPGTLIIANENRSTAFSTDNSLTAPINWIYDPTNRTPQIHYLLAYPTIRAAGMLPKIESGQPVYEDYLVAKFEGNTSQSIAIFYDGKSCLRVLDPAIDSIKTVGDEDLMKAAAFSDLSRILPLPEGQKAQNPLPFILRSPPSGTWCQLYEEADLLRQQRQWYNILQMWDQAKEKMGQSKFDGEFQPFVEAFARSGDWEQAAQLTPVSSKSRPSYCTLWQQLDRTGPDGPSKSKAVQASMAALRCSEYGLTPSSH